MKQSHKGQRHRQVLSHNVRQPKGYKEGGEGGGAHFKSNSSRFCQHQSIKEDNVSQEYEKKKSVGGAKTFW